MQTNKYFDVVINPNNSFYIVEYSSTNKPKPHGLALETLENIELVLKNNLEYDSTNHSDSYSKMSQDKLFNILKEKSLEIHNGYNKKLNWITRKFFSKEKEINAIHTRIDNYITPSKVLPLPNELAANPIIKQAQEFGYEGQDY